MEKLKEPLYEQSELEIDLDYFCKKLQITRDHYEGFIRGEKNKYSDFPSWESRYRVLKLLQKCIEKLLRRRINVYS
jgi:hypothetical protein